MRIATFGALVDREWRTSWADRGAYILRSLYASALLLGVVAAWVAVPLVYSGSPESIPELMRSMFDTFCRAQFGVASLVAAMTFSRAVCREHEQGTLDLLILSPLSRTEILLGKLAGEFLGLTALVASGIPVLFLLIPLGGVSPLQILTVQGVVLAQVLLMGGLSVVLAAAIGRSIPVMVCALAAMGILILGPDLGREWMLQKAPIWQAWESLTTYGILVQLTTKVRPEAGPALKAFGVAAAFGLLCCGLGSLVLERRHLAGRRTGLFALLAARIRRIAVSGSGKPLFRRLVPVEHPLLRRELAVDRDVAFRVCWILLVGVYAVLFRRISSGWFGADPHVELSTGGVAVAVIIAALVGAFQVASDRKRGALQALLASGVSPEDLIRSRLSGLVVRALYLVAFPAGHLLWILSYMKIIPDGVAWRVPAAIVGLVLGIIVMMEAVIQTALSLRRPEVAAVVAIFAAPAVLVAGLLPLTLSTLAVGLPLMIGGVLGGYAYLVRHTRKWVLR